MTDNTNQPWLEGLEQGPHPDDHTGKTCPWSRAESIKHDSWGYRHGDTLVIKSNKEAKAIMGDRRFQQGMRARMTKEASELDPRFLERRSDALLAREGPDHLRMRRIASKAAFTPRAASRHRPLMQQIMNELADGIPADGVIDGVQLVKQYPSRVIGHVLGSRPEEIASLSSTVDSIFSAQRAIPEAIPHAWPAQQALDAHILELVDRKRESPGDDLISDLIRAETEDGVLSTSEVHDIAIAVVMAGTETTRNVLARGLQLLAERPEAWATLSDDDLIPAAVEEILRFAPLTPMRRLASEALPVADREFPEGEVLIIDLYGTNRDPAVVDDPHTFRLDRTGPSQHLTLGHGHKFCLGANLAKAELQEAFRVLRSRFSTLELTDEEPEWIIGAGVPRGGRIMVRFGN